MYINRWRARTALRLLVVAGGVAATVVVGTEPSTNRPAVWAQPLTVTGVPNLHKVNDALYRSAQPTAVGMRNLKRMGIKTVINLRSFHSDRDELGDSGLAHEHIPMQTWRPEKEDVVRFLRIVNDPARAPVLVHCQHGADRTGTLCALYRVAVEGWTKEAAVREMTAGGFGFHEVWQNLPAWIRDLDIEAVRNAAGIVTVQAFRIQNSETSTNLPTSPDAVRNSKALSR